MDKLGPRVRVTHAKVGKRFNIEILFDTGEIRTRDLEPNLQGPIFQPVRDDPEAFKAVMIAGGTIAWDSGGDIDPDVLYYNLQPARLAPTESK